MEKFYVDHVVDINLIIMGNHSSKIKDFIFVTSSDLDPPELHAKREYNPTKNVDVSYGSYGAKKYWKENAT